MTENTVYHWKWYWCYSQTIHIIYISLELNQKLSSLYCQLQSNLTANFLRKRNRNSNLVFKSLNSDIYTVKHFQVLLLFGYLAALPPSHHNHLQYWDKDRCKVISFVADLLRFFADTPVANVISIWVKEPFIRIIPFNSLQLALEMCLQPSHQSNNFNLYTTTQNPIILKLLHSALLRLWLPMMEMSHIWFPSTSDMKYPGRGRRWECGREWSGDSYQPVSLNDEDGTEVI